MKPKHLRQPDRHVANLALGCASNYKFLTDPGLGIHVTGQVDVLCSRVLELEKELKRKDEELQEGQSLVAELQEQLSVQTKVIAELTKELQSKCIQLNKLQDVINTQGEHSLQPSPFRVTSKNQVSADRRKGAKEGVSAEPTTQLYDSSKQARFSFEKSRVRKDSSEKKLITDALNKNQFLKRLEPQQIREMVECMYERTFQQGSYVIRQGEPGNHIFVLKEGRLEVLQQNKLLSSIPVWTAFGELAILYNCTRTASVKAITNVKTWALDREVFQNIMRVTMGKSFFLYLICAHHFYSQVKVKNENVAFAMKCIKKKHVVDTKQQEHIYSEKKILEQICSPFIVKLYRTFKDSKYVYMLLEACLGGELWSLLRDRGSFDEPTTKFCVGCVTEALEYLHHIGIVYRDLKPENLILDAEGYIKLVDFGFAKKIGSGQKTWTFCGTPEYVAPEVILSKGHDFSVDFWSLGILVYELLTGSPPFSGADQMTTYNLILKGIEKLDFPRTITRRPEDLIRRLCRQNPTERLGNLRNGINDIKKHR
uniref:Protein kinase cGMP-dependent 2 n=1 Tax=Pavo cristatus TaxID=9049 RepID=A0A8C9ETM0_PAVCR